MKKIIPVLAFLIMFAPYLAAAQQAPGQQQPAASPAPAAAPSKPAGDEDQRLDLSRKMHEIQPARTQVMRAIDQVSQQLPPVDRDAFRNAMMSAIDDKKLEDMSIRAMADIFTVAELERMLSYFSSPEARSISEKMSVYNGRLQPEIMKMIDAAMMAARTGSNGAPPPAAQPVPKQK